jgi:hypothetical protein
MELCCPTKTQISIVHLDERNQTFDIGLKKSFPIKRTGYWNATVQKNCYSTNGRVIELSDQAVAMIAQKYTGEPLMVIFDTGLNPKPSCFVIACMVVCCPLLFVGCLLGGLGGCSCNQTPQQSGDCGCCCGKTCCGCVPRSNIYRDDMVTVTGVWFGARDTTPTEDCQSKCCCYDQLDGRTRQELMSPLSQLYKKTPCSDPIINEMFIPIAEAKVILGSPTMPMTLSNPAAMMQQYPYSQQPAAMMQQYPYSQQPAAMMQQYPNSQQPAAMMQQYPNSQQLNFAYSSAEAPGGYSMIPSSSHTAVMMQQNPNSQQQSNFAPSTAPAYNMTVPRVFSVER